MRELTIREIIEYASNIEAESHKFYTEASEKISHPETAQLAKELSEEETGHYNHLMDLINEKRLSSTQLDTIISGKEAIEDKMVKIDDITADSEPIDILEIALQREINTERLYTTYLTFTNLPENVIKVFEDLKHQEVGHQNRIKTLIKKLG